MSISKALRNEVASLVANKSTLAKIRGFLTYNDIPSKEIEQLIVEMDLKGGKPKTFTSDYYAFLSAERRIEAEARSYIEGLGEYGETSKNTKAHMSHFLNVWKLSVTIWNSK